MSLLLPVDDNGHPIHVLGFDYRGTTKLNVTNTSLRNPDPIASYVELVSIIATGACRFEVGDENVTADALTSPFLYPGTYVDVPLQRGARHVAFLAEDEDCVAYIISRI